MSKETDVAQDIAREAGSIMRKYFDGNQQVEQKSDGTVVTIADTEINTMVIERLKEQFPDDGVIGEEESTAEYGMGRRWFCDPIDGTTGFTWGTPTAAFSLALVEDGRPISGVAYDPFLDKMFVGEQGKPSTCNDRILNVSDKDLSNGVVAVTSSASRIAKGVPHVNKLVEQDVYLASFSGAVTKSVLVAQGKFVGYIEEGVNAHDMAAVQLIVEGAGGKVTGLDGTPYDYSKPFRGTIVSNGVVHEELVTVMQTVELLCHP